VVAKQQARRLYRGRKEAQEGMQFDSEVGVGQSITSTSGAEGGMWIAKKVAVKRS